MKPSERILLIKKFFEFLHEENVDSEFIDSYDTAAFDRTISLDEFLWNTAPSHWVDAFDWEESEDLSIGAWEDIDTYWREIVDYHHTVLCDDIDKLLIDIKL